ncbi:MAG: LTA synthase family protein [Planctomycetota bacterium]|nr:LTA synthase family protein [Planctomycetota bacterium]
MLSDAYRWMRSRQTRDDVHAVACALALCVFLWILKVHLACWYIFSRGVPALEELGFLSVLLLGGGDVVLCAIVAAVYAMLFHGGRALGRVGGVIVATILPFVAHAAIVVFSTVSWQVHQIYACPLEIGHLRAADNLATMWDSIAAYLGLLPITFILVGLLSYPLLGWLFRWLLGKVMWLQVRWRLWAVTLVGAAAIGAMWMVRMRGIYAYGLKRNAVLHFVQYYHPVPKAVDVKDLLAKTNASVKDYDDELRQAASISVSTPMLPAAGKHEGKADGFNVLIVLMESTSAAYIDAKTTPNLLRLAETGLSLKDHYIVFSETYKALYALIYSDYLPELGGRPRALYNRPLPQRSIADVLKTRGYQTAFFHSGYLAYAGLDYLVAGFDAKVDGAMIPGATKPWVWGIHEEQTVAALSQWISANKGKPFFMVYSTIFPHHPYVSLLKERPFPHDTWVHRYSNSLAYADYNVGKLIDFLDKEKLRENTLIVVVGDHGETVSSFPVGHGLAMTLEEIRTPCIISNPKLFPTKQEGRLSTSHLDVAPTLAHLLGVEESGEWLGRDILADQVPARMLFMRMDQGKVSGVADNGLVYVLDDQSARSKLYEVVDNRLVPVGSNDPRSRLVDQYKGKVQKVMPWAVWRHLKRATAQ